MGSDAAASLSASGRADAAASPDGASAGHRADAGARTCFVARGPIELPIRSPIALAVHGDAIDAVMNEDGRPRIVTRPAGPAPLAPVPAGRETVDGPKAAGYGVPCAVAGEHIFCPDRAGAVRRTNRAGAEEHVVASARTSTRIAAGALDAHHVALVYLASRQTSEGWVSEAWMAVDDEAPRRISEDGSGATALAVTPRGRGLLVLMVDARTALTALHVRPVSFADRPVLGEDSVIFVGGPGDRRTRAALAVPPAGAGFSFLPIARDIGTFGLAVVRVDDPAKVDEPMAWTMYPNGLDPAPVAAAIATRGGASTTWVALVRPRGPEVGSPRVLELGAVSPEGAFEPREELPTDGNVSDVALAADASGALWVAWVDAGGTWLERLACGLKARAG